MQPHESQFIFYRYWVVLIPSQNMFKMFTHISRVWNTSSSKSNMEIFQLPIRLFYLIYIIGYIFNSNQFLIVVVLVCPQLLIRIKLWSVSSSHFTLKILLKYLSILYTFNLYIIYSLPRVVILQYVTVILPIIQGGLADFVSYVPFWWPICFSCSILHETKDTFNGLHDLL